jgi:ABC-type branched-subunit amino acid transport system ATPase component
MPVGNVGETALETGFSPVSGPACLEATAITVEFGGLKALSEVSVSIPRGTVVGLVGPNGAGKSTLFAVLSGLLTPRSGRVSLGGVDVTRESAQSRARQGMARTFQHPELFSNLTIREHIVLADRVKHSHRRLWSDLVDGKALRRSEVDEDDRVDRILRLLDLDRVAHRRAVGLPLGMCRLIEVARALATSPSMLLLDEPGAGLRPGESERLAKTLLRVVGEQGVALLLVEHDLDMVLGMSSSVYVLDFGVCIAHGSPEEIRRNSVVAVAYLGTEQAVDVEVSIE